MAAYCLIVLSLLLLSACDFAVPPVPTSGEERPDPNTAGLAEASRAPAETGPESDAGPAQAPEPAIPSPTSAAAQPKSAQVAEYDLGESTIALAQVVGGGPIEDMPLRLDGVLGVPAAAGAHPLVLILHGDHLGCPPDQQTNKAAWPCDEGQEQRNYRGFTYLVEELASAGYLALAINANAAYTEAYGDAGSAERLGQIIDRHLAQLIDASAGGENNFGVDLYGRVDDKRVVWIAHSRSAELASRIIRDRRLDDGLNAAFAGYGPLLGLLQVAPTLAQVDSQQTADLPLAVILPACDGQVSDLAGQATYEALRDDRQRQAPAATLLLEAADHNQFNEVVTPDMLAGAARPQCRFDQLLQSAEQRAFLAAYAVEFLAWVLGTPQESSAAAEALGLAVTKAVPGQILGRPALVAHAPDAADEMLLLRPFGAGELTHNLLGGDVIAENLQTLFCPAGSSLHGVDSSLSACHRLPANHPGSPAQMLLTWPEPDGLLRLNLPPEGVDLTRYTALQLRAALDPLSPLNTPGEARSFSVTLHDTEGGSATLAVPPEAPALAYPRGEIMSDGRFSGHVQMSALRLPLAAFAAVDLTQIVAVELLFDRTPSGALFIADLGFVRPPRYPGAASTLLINDGSLDHLRGVGRFQGTSACTAVLIDTGSNDAAAVILTNGHCAQQWSAAEVLQNEPAADMQMIFNYFANTRAVQVTVPAARVLYSSMKGRDIALVELAATQGDLLARDIFPFPLAAAPLEGAPEVEVLGAPTAELPSDEAYLRHEQCRANGRVSLLEYEWQFNDAYRLDCQDIYGGSSGSPLFAGDTIEIFGLINTTSIGGRTPCYLNAPCEITPGGVTFRPDTAYATPVDGLAACFGEDGRFNLTLAGCPLDNGRQLTISGYPRQAVNPSLTQPDGSAPQTSWNATLRGDLPYYRYKIGPLAATDCRRGEGYSDVQLLAARPSIDDPLPQTEGHYVLCLLAGPGPQLDSTWQQPQHATAARIAIDTTPPAAAPALTISAEADHLLIQPDADPPELTAFLLKSGPLATTNCANQAGYTNLGSRSLILPTTDLPALVCVIGLDAAGNQTAPVRQIVDVSP